MIQYGTTIGQIASNFYEANWILGMDLIQEYNPQIEDLNWIFAGEGLRLPPLTKETLLRKRPDGSYHLILSSFHRSAPAENLAKAVRLKGYPVTIIPRKVADNFTLYRVVVPNVKGLKEANQAWDSALANRWIPLADTIR